MTALPVQSAAPAALPLTLDEVKAHCRVDSADDDAILTSLIHAATGHFDGWTGTLGRCLVTQDWSIEFVHAAVEGA